MLPLAPPEQRRSGTHCKPGHPMPPGMSAGGQQRLLKSLFVWLQLVRYPPGQETPSVRQNRGRAADVPMVPWQPVEYGGAPAPADARAPAVNLQSLR
jgi:hypothetical protein